MNQQNRIIEKRKIREDEENSGKKRPKSSIRRCGLPAELLNKLFGSLPLENAFFLLAKMPNGLLARNVQKMISELKVAMKNNKWNNDCGCGHLLKISEDGLTVKYFGQYGTNSVYANVPAPRFNVGIKKSAIAFYFEVQICHRSYSVGLCIGFNTKYFPREDEIIEYENNSIEILSKDGIYICGSFIEFGNANYLITFENIDICDIKNDDVIGLGIIHHPNLEIECFATCNGELLGKAELPAKFGTMKLFPTINFRSRGDSIRGNFDKKAWLFKQFKDLLK